MKEAEAARSRGESHMTALCGDVDTIPTSWSERSSNTGPVAPDRIDWDTEFEDPETGEWWIDMDCVNCLSVTNQRRLLARRDYLDRLLMWFAARPENIGDGQMEEVITLLEGFRPSSGTE